MKNLRWLLRTDLPGSAIYPRLFLAFLIALGGLRAMGLNPYLGKSRLAEPPFELTGGALWTAGLIEVLGGVLLATGLFTRVVAVMPLVISSLIIREHWARVGTLGTAGALDTIILAFGAAGVALMLIFRGAGVWSMDASLSSKR